MALNAVHIRSSRPNQADRHHPIIAASDLDAGHTPPKTIDDDDEAAWRGLRTRTVLRPPPRFVKATQLSEPDQPTTSNSGGSSELSDEHRPSTPTLSQLYASLTQHLAFPEPSSPSLPSTSHLVSADVADPLVHTHGKGKQRLHDPTHRHHHQHHPEARYKSEWFISRALTKMRRSNHVPTEAARTAAAQPPAAPAASAATSRRQRCQRCGDLLPANATLEDMARHRQSIGHRLGLNADLASASASEAPSPAASKSPTPTATPPPGSASASSAAISLLEASMQALHRRSQNVPRRLCNAPRWKKIARDNVGHNMLSRMGWKEGMGLGVLESKRHQQTRDRLKQKRSNAVRLLLRQQASAVQSGPDGFGPDPTAVEPQVQEEWLQLISHQPSSSQRQLGPLPLEAAFPFEHQDHTPEQQRQMAQSWLDGMAQTDADWFQHLGDEDQQALEQALLTGQITLQDIQTALWDLARDQRCSAYAHADAAEGSALLHPVQVELRSGRVGLGAETGSARHRRRSRDEDRSVSIRRTSSPSLDMLGGAHKKPRAAALAPTGVISRSSSKAAVHKRTAQLAARKRRQREMAYEQSKREWLDLRASLS